MNGVIIANQMKLYHGIAVSLHICNDCFIGPFAIARCIFLLFIFSLSLFLISCGSSSSTSENKSYTILVYMEGTDLEEDYALTTGNIIEMLAATPSSKISIVLTTGAANKAVSTDPVKSWKTMKRHVIENGAINELQDLGNLDMGSSTNLTDFIIWGQTNYPADRYILVFSDHGGGALGGFGTTMINPQLTPMTITDMRKGIADAVKVTGKNFEIIGFDACLMATIEVAYAFKDFGNYLAASEDLEPGTGWAWTDLVNYVAANPYADGASIGKGLADSYLAKMKNSGSDAAITFSITDLSKIQNVATALASFASWQQELLDSKRINAWDDLAYARSRSLDFFTANLTMAFMDMVDTLDMVNRDGFQSPQTTALINAVNNAVIYKVAGSLRGAARGLSLMFPSGNVWLTDRLDLYQSLPFLSASQTLVVNFATFARNNVPDKIISDPILAGNTMTSNVTPADVYYEQAYACMAVTSSGVTSVYGHQPIWSSFTGKLEYTWGGLWYTLNGTIVSVMAEPSTEAVVTLRIPMEVNGDTGVYYLRYDYTSATAELLGFLKNEAKQLTNYPYKGLVQLPPGAIVTPMVYGLDSSNWLKNEWKKGTNTFTVPPSGLVFAKTTLTPGSYNVGFMIDDLRLKPSFSNLATFTK
jgi:hypothetical protein